MVAAGRGAVVLAEGWLEAGGMAAAAAAAAVMAAAAAVTETPEAKLERVEERQA